MIFSVNGRLVDGDETGPLSPLDRGLLYGDGLFETFRVGDGHIEFMNEHLERLFSSIDALKIPFSWDRDRTAAALQEVVQANDGGDLALRLTVTRGVGGERLDTKGCNDASVLITVSRLSDARPIGIPEPISIVTAPFPKNEHSPLARHKTLNYLEPILARAAAREAGADEALMLNTAGRVAEASAANIFVYIEGEGVSTPTIDEGALPGIIRAAVLRVSRDMGSPVIERPILPNELTNAKEILITNSLITLTPVARIDGKDLPSPFSAAIIDTLLPRVRSLAERS